MEAVIQLKVIIKAKSAQKKGIKEELQKRVSELETALTRWKTQTRENFERFTRDILTEEQFVSLQQESKRQQAELAEQLSEQKEKLDCFTEQQQNMVRFLPKRQLAETIKYKERRGAERKS